MLWTSHAIMFTNILGKGIDPLLLLAQSAGVVKYTDYFSAEG